MDSAKLIPESLKGRFGMKVAWRLEMEEGWLSLWMGRDLFGDRCFMLSGIQQTLGRNINFPNAFRESWPTSCLLYCVHGSTGLSVEERLTRKD